MQSAPINANAGYKLSDDQIRQLHDAITGQGVGGFQAIIDEAKALFGCPAGGSGSGGSSGGGGN